MRDELGAALVDWGKKEPQLVVLDGDLSTSTRTSLFRDAFPNRFFNMGIAEQDMVGTAIGLTLAGKNVVVGGFTMFTLGRAWEFVRLAAHDIRPVKFCPTHAALSPGQDGCSHQCLEDLALACSIPHLNVVAPADSLEARQILNFVIPARETFYVRLTRNAAPAILPEEYQFDFGRAKEVIPGSDVTILAYGGMLGTAMKAAAQLKSNEISAQVVNISTLKPLDVDSIIKFARNTGALVVAEDHNVITGIGAQVAAQVSQKVTIPVELVGINDQFGQSGSEEELKTHYKLTAEEIVVKAKRGIKRKDIRPQKRTLTRK